MVLVCVLCVSATGDCVYVMWYQYRFAHGSFGSCPFLILVCDSWQESDMPFLALTLGTPGLPLAGAIGSTYAAATVIAASAASEDSAIFQVRIQQALECDSRCDLEPL